MFKCFPAYRYGNCFRLKHMHVLLYLHGKKGGVNGFSAFKVLKALEQSHHSLSDDAASRAVGEVRVLRKDTLARSQGLKFKTRTQMILWHI